MSRTPIYFAAALVVVAQVASAASTVRVSGDNVWIVFHDGERIASGDNWQAPTVTEFDLDKNGRALIAIYVLDVGPGADGVGAMLADIILDDGTYIPTSEDEPGWVCDRGGFDRNGDWVTVAFDDSAWIPLSFFDKFPGGVWGGGAALMTAAFGAPEVDAYWSWCLGNGKTDDAYFRYRIETLAVEPNGKSATRWATLKAAL